MDLLSFCRSRRVLLGKHLQFFVYTEHLSESDGVCCLLVESRLLGSCLFRLGMKYLGNEPSFSGSDSAYKSFLYSTKKRFCHCFSSLFKCPAVFPHFSENSKWHLLTENGYCELSLRNVRRRTLHAEKMEMFVQCHF